MVLPLFRGGTGDVGGAVLWFFWVLLCLFCFFFGGFFGGSMLLCVGRIIIRICGLLVVLFVGLCCIICCLDGYWDPLVILADFCFLETIYGFCLLILTEGRSAKLQQKPCATNPLSVSVFYGICGRVQASERKYSCGKDQTA